MEVVEVVEVELERHVELLKEESAEQETFCYVKMTTQLTIIIYIFSLF